MKLKIKNAKFKIKEKLLPSFLIFNFEFLIFPYFVPWLPITLLLLFSYPSLSVANNWPGVDEAVVEKIAKEHGREAHPALINTDQGDLLLFVFLIAGVVGGFAAGYNWRKLMEGRPKKQ